MTIRRVSRRQLLRAGAGAVLNGPTEGETVAKPDREWKWSRLEAISPDGQRICISHERAAGMAYEIRVFDTLDWRNVDLIDLPFWNFHVSFFDDNRRVYIDFFGKTTRRIVVDTRTRSVEERQFPYQSNGEFSQYQALSGLDLMGEVDFPPEMLAIREFPGFAEKARRPFGSLKRNGGHSYAEPIVSRNRGTIVYATAESVICLRADDLSETSAFRVDPPLLVPPVGALAVSADGALAGVILAEPRESLNVGEKRSVHLFRVEDGAQVARFQSGGIDRIAISPDGKLVAVGKRTYGPETELTANVYEIASGRLLASFLHYRGHVKLLNSHFWGMEFMADGLHLLTGNFHTRLWTVRDA